jgi:3',5'-cyclic AMP phosphodiesterase CpdA
MTELESRFKECDVIIALTHHPLKGGGYSGSADWNGSDGPLRAFLETYIIGKFDLHISGHVHILADDGKDEGTRLLISGTGGEVLGDGRAGFVVLRWEPKNPKRIGYYFRHIDTEVNVYNEGAHDQIEILDFYKLQNQN